MEISAEATDAVFAANQIQGERPYQEDEFGESSSVIEGINVPTTIALADGMGGHAAGDVASRTAIVTFLDVFGNAAGIDISERMHVGLTAVNDTLKKIQTEQPEKEGMGCTFVAAHLSEEGLWWISVGDSPMWLFRAGELIRLNADHSMAPVLREMVERGEITAEEMTTDPRRNALRAAVMGETIELVDLTSEAFEIHPDDILIMATDGLETLSEEEICSIIDQYKSNVDAIVQALLLAVENVGKKRQDNTTVLVSKIHEIQKLNNENFNVKTEVYRSTKTKKQSVLEKIKSHIWPYGAAFAFTLLLLGLLIISYSNGTDTAPPD